MSALLLKNGTVLLEGAFQPADVFIDDEGLIQSVTAPGEKQSELQAEAVETIDLTGKYLAAGFFDLHFHGLEDKTCTGSDLSDLAAIELRHGVTSFTPTLCAAGENLLKLLERKSAQARNLENGPRVPGFYLEGPFVALPGAIPPDCLMPADLSFARELLAVGRDMIRVIMISPELDGAAELIELMTDAGVTVALGHTAANIDQTRRAIDAGARLATHIYNVYDHLPESPEPGVWPVGAYDVLVADDRVTCELIADGIHVHPVNAKIVYRVKGSHRLALITDSNVGAGLAPGRYGFPGWPMVEIRPGDAVRDAEHGWLCGSSITVDEGVRRAPGMMECALADACVMASETIFNTLGLGENFGKIAPGYLADVVIMDKDFQVQTTLVGGKIVYKK
jgi:N-acetylglucosamine-6-phosphate deacetylase